MPNIFRTSSALRLFCLSLLMLLAASPMWATGSSTIVISQLYGAGGNSGSVYTVDYVELFNLGTTPVSLTGYALQYSSAGGSGPAVLTIGSSATLQPGQYFLVAAGTTGTKTADAVVTAMALSGTAGRVFLTNSTTVLSSNCPGTGGSVVDFVGYGSTATCFEGTGPAPVVTAAQAEIRTNRCVDTDNNSADFTAGTPTPHNSSDTLAPCGGSVTPVTLSVTAAFANTAANTGGTDLLTATVTPATSPASTGVTVTADLSAFGGTATTSLHDDGLNGDAKANDNIYSYSLAIPAQQANKAYTVNITAKDQTTTATAMASVTVSTPASPSTGIAISSSSSNPVLNTSVTFTAIITGSEPSTPTGTVTFFDGNTQLGVGVSVVAGTWTYSTSMLAVGPHAITATYSGDGVYPSNTVTMPASVPVNVEPVPVTGFNFSLSNTSIVVNGDTHTGSTTMNVNFILGFNSPVTFSCSGLPAGSRCVFSPATLTASGTSTLTVGIDGASLKSTRPFGAGERTLAALGLLGLPLLMRRRKKLASTALGLLMLGAMAVSLSGCSGGTSTPSGTSTIMVTATSGSTTHSQAITLNVQ